MTSMEPPALLLLACAGAIYVVARAQEHCDSKQFGETWENDYNLEEQRMAPDELFLEIIDTDVCKDAEIVGMKVLACDTDQAPRVYVQKTRGLVVREGRLGGAASVYTTVFCAAGSEVAPDKSVQIRQQLPSEEAGVSFETTTVLLQPTSTPAPPDTEYTSMITSTTESLPVVHLESRFSSNNQLQLPQIPFNQSPGLEDIWKSHGSPSLGHANTAPLSILGPAILHQTNHPYPIPDSSFFNGLPVWPKKLPLFWPEISLPLGKRLSRLSPGQPSEWIINQTPAWLQQSIRPPPLPMLKPRSNYYWDARKYMSRHRNKHPNGQIFKDPRSLYDGILPLYWSELGSIPRFSNAAPFIHHYGSRRPKYIQSQNQNKGSLIFKHPSPNSVKHASINRLEIVPSIYEEYPDLLTEWKYNHKTQRQVRPKPQFLLQDESNQSGRICASCASTHSVEDGETWLSDLPAQGHAGDDVLTGYSAVNVDSQGSYFTPKQYMVNIERWKSSNLPQRLQFPTVYKKDFSDSSLFELFDHSLSLESQPCLAVKQLPWYLKCLPVNPIDVPERHRQYRASSRHRVHTLSNDHFGPDATTEHPATTLMDHHLLSWVKNSKFLLTKDASAPLVELSVQATPVKPCSLLSQLLLSTHPTFRDFTQVIRI